MLKNHNNHHTLNIKFIKFASDNNFVKKRKDVIVFIVILS